MTTEQQRKILEAAAKACGFIYDKKSSAPKADHVWFGLWINGTDEWNQGHHWNSITNSADTANMCAKLGINTFFYLTIPKVGCGAVDAGDEQTIRYTVSHNGTDAGKEAAWRLAASTVAAKIGGYEE